jgi:hypothetical protein
MRMELSTLPKGNTIIGRQTKRWKSNTFPQLMKGGKRKIKALFLKEIRVSRLDICNIVKAWN